MAPEHAPAGTTSASLLERLQQPQRDEVSWQRFLDLYRPWLTAWLRRRVPPDLVEDLLQEMVVAVCRRLPEFEHNGRPGSFRAWLKAILKNCLRSSQKKQRLLTSGAS